MSPINALACPCNTISFVIIAAISFTINEIGKKISITHKLLKIPYVIFQVEDGSMAGDYIKIEDFQKLKVL
jgi:hypothetical protein